MTEHSPPLLAAENLRRTYRRRKAAAGEPPDIVAVDDVSLSLGESETLAIVGESGSGKSTLVRLLLALEKPDRGVVRFNGHSISTYPESRIRPLRRGFQAVFQDPGASLNPCLRVSTLIAEPLVAHSIGSGAERREIVADLLNRVGLPADAAGRYPSEFSGGERQRIAIARALAPRPQLLICDEPVSSLDMSVQSHILSLIAELHQDLNLALVVISHDLNVVRELCRQTAVLQSGKIVESGETTDVLTNPTHPYTRTLLDAAPTATT